MSEIRLLKIGELEKLSGFSRHTIHQYIKRGLLDEPVRTGKTMAYYYESHLECLNKIREITGGARLPLSYVKDQLEKRETVEKKTTGDKPPAKDGQSRGDDREKGRQRIREVAMGVFQEKGYHQTRIQDITAAAEISTGTFYLNYKDKRELFMDVVDNFIEYQLPLFEEEIMKDPDVMQRVAARAKAFFYGYKLYSEMSYVLMGIVASREPWASDRVIALLRKLMEPMMNDIRVGIKKWKVREVDPELLTHALVGMAELLAFRLALDDKYSHEQVTSFMVDLVMNGIAKG
jgi:AcrR family transcriptional regulator/predicted DNA-binding transcriptional regulator AlpA